MIRITVALGEQAPFTKRVFDEAEPALAEALRRRVTSGPVILEADGYAPETIARIRAEMPANALGQAFVDNLGTDVTFETLRKLTQDRKIDLMIVGARRAEPSSVWLRLRQIGQEPM